MLVPPLFPLDEKIRRYSHFAKRSAVILTLRKDPPLSNRGVALFRLKELETIGRGGENAGEESDS